MEKRARWLLVIIVVISMIVTSAAVSLIYLQSYEKTTYDFGYSVNIEKTGTGNYTLIIPFPAINDNETYWNQNILDNIIVNGSAEINLIETIHGTGLEIKSDENCRLNILLDIFVPAETLSMNNHTDNETWYTYYWIYGYQNNCNVTMNISMFQESCTTTYINFRPWASGGGPYIFLPEYDKAIILTDWNLYEAVNSNVVIN